MKRTPRRIFTAKFRREAIKLITEQGLTLAEAGEKLDVATKSLRIWMDQQERGELKPGLGESKLLGQRADGELLWHTQNGKPASTTLLPVSRQARQVDWGILQSHPTICENRQSNTR